MRPSEITGLLFSSKTEPATLRIRRFASGACHQWKEGAFAHSRGLAQFYGIAYRALPPLSQPPKHGISGLHSGSQWQGSSSEADDLPQGARADSTGAPGRRASTSKPNRFTQRFPDAPAKSCSIGRNPSQSMNATLCSIFSAGFVLYPSFQRYFVTLQLTIF